MSILDAPHLLGLEDSVVDIVYQAIADSLDLVGWSVGRGDLWSCHECLGPFVGIEERHNNVGPANDSRLSLVSARESSADVRQSLGARQKFGGRVVHHAALDGDIATQSDLHSFAQSSGSFSSSDDCQILGDKVAHHVALDGNIATQE